jgi:RNA polymerase sigma-70 factor (ECF subfamily)
VLNDEEMKRLLLRTAARDEGSAEAFERLYKACAPLLLGVAKRIVRRAELAEEALHDGFASIWRAAGSFDPLGARAVAWMVAIVRNRALDTVARHADSRVESYDDDAPQNVDGALDRLFEWGASAEEMEDRRRSLRWLRDCLARLQAPERQALVLAYERGLSHSELAAHLGRPLGTAKSWVRRGMANLRRCVETQMEAGR